MVENVKTPFGKRTGFVAPEKAANDMFEPVEYVPSGFTDEVSPTPLLDNIDTIAETFSALHQSVEDDRARFHQKLIADYDEIIKQAEDAVKRADARYVELILRS